MKEKIKKIAENIYELPKQGKMKVPGKIFVSDKLFKAVEEKCITQLLNVAQLPGIVNYSLAMSDVHSGYGFPIGGVAAFDLNHGIISPGGVGYDINCGVRLLTTSLEKKDFIKKRKEVLDELYKNVPSGVGRKSEFRLSDKELKEVLEKGMSWAVEKGYATQEDQERCEDNGFIEQANAAHVSAKAVGRGKNQLGTLGSGNHFLELQEVERIFDDKLARTFGLQKGHVVIMIHCGSRGLGHQVASDYIQAMEKEYGFTHLPDRELAYAPINSKLGKNYRAAMAAAANFAFVNRQLITHQTRKSIKTFFPTSKLTLVYDVAHNIAKFETFTINGKNVTLCVHRKGATRSFGPGKKELPVAYRKTGQPILLPGSMGTFSYVLVGTDKAAHLSFASTAHGAGRVLSRSYTTQHLNVDAVKKELSDYGVMVKAGSDKGLVEEAPAAYKNIDEVARVSNALGIGKLVARLKPLAVVKG